LTAAQVIAIAEETKPARIRTVLQPSKETSTPPMINVALKPRLRRIGVILFAPPAVGAAFWGFLHLTGNFNAVVPGEFYRSAQLTPAQLSEYVGAYKLRTVINLRGDNKGQPWYDAEVKESDHLGIVHVDFGMSARHELTRAQAIALIALMEKAAKPLLVHCKDGADRAGLASALYLAVVKQADSKVAEAQLSFRYGHISLPFIPEYAMERSFEALEPSLAASSAIAPPPQSAPD
jgi:protein tyrosine/serine phosphatase